MSTSTALNLCEARSCSWVCESIRRGLFPLVLAIALTAAAGIHLGWLTPMGAQIGVFVITILAVLLAERLLPFSLAWRDAPADEKRVDLTSLAMLMFVVDPLLKRLLWPMLFSWVVAFTQPNGLGWFPTELPIALQVLLAAVIAELGQYAAHRAAHNQSWMWNIHTFHHAPARLNLLNGFRVNPINVVWHQLSGLFVLMVLGAPGEVLQMLVVITTMFSTFQHANADLRYDGWNQFLATADLHRWHHAASATDSQCNFGSTLTLWDRVFGTYRRPVPVPWKVGISGFRAPEGGYLAWLARTSARPKRLPE